MQPEHKISCDVCDCCYNECGCTCKKQSVVISHSEKGNTCCESYRNEWD